MIAGMNIINARRERTAAGELPVAQPVAQPAKA